jgi:hypothetical protein
MPRCASVFPESHMTPILGCSRPRHIEARDEKMTAREDRGLVTGNLLRTDYTLMYNSDRWRTWPIAAIPSFG